MSEQPKRSRPRRPSAAMAVAIVALICALTGTSWAALGSRHQRRGLAKKSVGTRQLKPKAVTSGKIANNAVNGTKVADGSLTGADIDVGALGTVPAATSAASAANAGTVGGHAAACPGGTTLVRGLCFDSSPGPEVANVKAAADACAGRGGWLPSAIELYSVRSVINLGSGIGADHQLTGSYYANDTGGAYYTVTVDGTGAIVQQEATAPGHYVCAYPLLR
jgi:hypothetical protein